MPIQNIPTQEELRENLRRRRENAQLTHDQEKARILKELDGFMHQIKYGKSGLKKKFGSCCICFEDFEEGSLVRETPCMHLFHSYCLMNWFKTKLPKADCPNCRLDFILP